MGYGLNERLPKENPELVRKMSLRWLRAAGPHNKWAKIAKTCTEMLEGNQWPEGAKETLNNMGRSALTLNKIAPLWRLIMGYQSSNRLDFSFLPTSDSVSSEDVADLLDAMAKAESNRMDLRYADSEVFGDGITGGRGFWDLRLNFEENDFGELEAVCSDPFNTYLDPDCNTYDLNKSAAYIQDSVWTDLDAINSTFGSDAAMALENMSGPATSSSLLSFFGEIAVAPKAYFGQYADADKDNWQDIYHADFVDKQAKRLRLLDSQYKITVIAPCFVDLETGEKAAIPDDWLKPENQQKIQACLDYAQQLNNPLKIVNRPVKKIRWTVTCADILLHDSWSPYSRYTKVGYFPYFRRGTTRGAVEDLIDPQREVNKKRSVMMDILNRNANTGWMYEDKSLDPEQEENLRKYGSALGINIKWKRIGQQGDSPKRIEPGAYPQGLDRLEEKAATDLKEISGINESALGQLDQVQSGRAIEARQRQAVLSIQMYSDNFSRSKKIQGRNILECFQTHYTEERTYRIINEDSSMAVYEINKKQQTGVNSYTRMNDITVGKYSVVVDETPISATFKQGQFEEVMMLMEKLGPVGQALVQADPSLLIDMTSLPRKEDWKKAMKASMASASAPDPELQSKERIAARKDETSIAVAALQGVKDSGLVLPEMIHVVQRAAQTDQQDQAGGAAAGLPATPPGPEPGQTGEPVMSQPTPEGMPS